MASGTEGRPTPPAGTTDPQGTLGDASPLTPPPEPQVDEDPAIKKGEPITYKLL